MSINYTSLRIDALGALAALALTLGAGAVAVGPRFLARGPSPADQKAELERRRREAGALDTLAEATRLRLAELSARSAGALRLQPATRVNERLVEITELAASGDIAISQLTPGAAPPTIVSTEKKTAPPSPIDGKAIVVPIKLAGTGRCADLTRFLHALHERFRDTAVTALKLNALPGSAASAGASENPSGSFTIDLAWYAAPAGSADAGAKP